VCIKLVYIYVEFFEGWLFDFWPDPTLAPSVLGLLLAYAVAFSRTKEL